MHVVDDVALVVGGLHRVEPLEVLTGLHVDDQQPGLLVVDVETGEHLERLNPVEATDDEGNVINDVHGVGVRVTTGDEAVVGAAPAGVRPVAVAATSFTCHLPV